MAVTAPPVELARRVRPIQAGNVLPGFEPSRIIIPRRAEANLRSNSVVLWRVPRFTRRLLKCRGAKRRVRAAHPVRGRQLRFRATASALQSGGKASDWSSMNSAQAASARRESWRSNASAPLIRASGDGHSRITTTV